MMAELDERLLVYWRTGLNRQKPRLWKMTLPLKQPRKKPDFHGKEIPRDNQPEMPSTQFVHSVIPAKK